MVRAPGAEPVQAGRLSRKRLLPASASCFSVRLAPAPHRRGSSEWHKKMAASRHSQLRLDSEIDRSRAECQWEWIQSLVGQLSSRSPDPAGGELG
ncbi:hypothetical protein NDU88_005958 [Pleurodeles waltl]|uniref:Uncharacterized protein n=1 Tax=Pleurodeles waltl TaxID=8319 RepID=A0AAV7MBY2_PLEWA|nr:hypothetical protein NDU88_005958 [Pleurodeles waltl]